MKDKELLEFLGFIKSNLSNPKKILRKVNELETSFKPNKKPKKKSKKTSK